ncbi:hypothetical protein [Cupriavidus necator]
MAFKTVLVELGRDIGCAARVGVAADLAKRSGGHVVGLTAAGVPFERIPDASSDAERYLDVARVGLATQADEMAAWSRKTRDGRWRRKAAYQTSSCWHHRLTRIR